MSNSTRRGIAVTSFPDVCKTPAAGAGGPVPIPYPNVARPAPGAAGKQIKIPPRRAGSVPGSHFKRAAGDQAGTRALGAGVISSAAGAGTTAQLRTRINQIHSKLGALAAQGGGNPNQWHALVDEYVVNVAELYKARARV